MAIESVGNINSILQNYKTNDWTKGVSGAGSAELKGINFNEMLSTPATKKESFADMLANSISDVNSLQKDADKAVQKLVSGESKNLHETMLAVEKAEIAFKTMNQVRSKIIDAYKEVMRMQI